MVITYGLQFHFIIIIFIRMYVYYENILEKEEQDIYISKIYATNIILLIL